MPKKKSQISTEDSVPFEEAMERVESIVDAMESDSLQLEEMLVRYEEGARLLVQCQETIEAAQRRVEIIASERKNGSVTLKTFDGETDSSIDPTSAVRSEPDPKPSNIDNDPEEGSDDIRLF